MLDRDIVELFYKEKEQDLKELLDVNPTPVRPIVTQQDVKAGYLLRYFIRPVNDKTYIVEINKNQYDNLKSNSRFITVSVKWKIVGKKETYMLLTGANIYGVGDMNRIEVANADLVFGGLKNYISDYLEFWFSE
jgi:hypothetical protein